ncbi:MAG: M28 family peptidase [Planctomycetes bacterium]|nr:M28 family peptidase [Planctomycetota bacterium]
MRLHTSARLLPLFLAGLTLTAQAQDAAHENVSAAILREIQTEALEASQVQDWLHTITQDFGPRLTTSKRLVRAQDWAVEEFKKMGLEVELEQWGTFPVGFDRGESSGKIVSPVEKELVFQTSAWTVGTDGPKRGPAIAEPQTMEELEALKDKLVGAWVVRRVERPDRKVRREFDKLCREVAILGSLRAGPENDLLVTSGNHMVNVGDLSKDVKIQVLRGELRELVELCDNSEEPVELEFDLDHKFTEGPIPLYNVVATLRGTEFPDEYVFVQAHIDSWDGAEGTCDNGTGTSTTLEAARILSGLDVKPRRSVRFLLYSGEEQGLYGSKKYVENHPELLPKISIVLNHDNGTNFLRGINATAAMRPQFERVFAPVQALSEEFSFTIHHVDTIRTGGGSSDHAPYCNVGVPAFHWDQNSDGYRYIHHTQNDVFSSAIPEQQRHSAAVVSLSAWGFANEDKLVDRTDMQAPPQRKMGVYLDGLSIRRVLDDTPASRAGWQAGDEIVAVHGEAIDARRDLSPALQRGGPEVAVRVKRGDEFVETILDYSDDPDEEARARWRERRAQREAEEAEEDGGERPRRGRRGRDG